MTGVMWGNHGQTRGGGKSLLFKMEPHNTKRSRKTRRGLNRRVPSQSAKKKRADARLPEPSQGGDADPPGGGKGSGDAQWNQRVTGSSPLCFIYLFSLLGWKRVWRPPVPETRGGRASTSSWLISSESCSFHVPQREQQPEGTLAGNAAARPSRVGRLALTTDGGRARQEEVLPTSSHLRLPLKTVSAAAERRSF